MPREQLQPVVRQIRRLAGDPPSERDDAFLLNQFAAHRDGQAFETLVRRHGRLVRSVCRHVLRCEEDAEDAFQATFLVLARRAGAVHGHRSLAAWLHGVALRAAWNARRSAMRRRQRDTSITTVAQREPEQPVTEAALREVQAILDEEVQRLPEKLRVPFVACCLEGKSKAEAARDLGWKEGTVSGRLAQARERLRDRLTRRGVSLSAALCALAVTSEATVALPGAVVTGTARAAIQFVTSGGEGQGAIVATQALRAMAGGKIKVAVLLTCSLLAVSAIGYQLSVGGGQPRDGTKPAVDEPKAESRQPRADLHGDPLPPGAVARMGTVRFRNGNLIAGVAYSPDGKWLASGGYGGTVRLHDSATGKEVRTLETQASQFPAIVFSPDGKTLATIGHKLVQLWETATGKELRRFAAEVSDHYAFEFVVPAVFSPDGKVLASVAEDHCVRLWDAETGKELHKLIGHKNPVRCLAYSRDAKVLYSATGDSVMGGSVRAWDVATGVELRKIALRGGGQAGQPGSPLGFSSNGQVLAFQAHEILRRANVPRANVLDWQVVSLLDLSTGEVRLKLEPERGRFKSAAFSPDGKLVATVNGEQRVTNFMQTEDLNRLKVWDTATGKLLFDFPAYSEHHGFKGPAMLVFSPDSKFLAAAGSGSALHVWDLTRGREHLESPDAHHHEIWTVAYSSDGRTMASGSSDHSIALWDAACGKQLLRLRGHEGTVAALAFSPDDKLLASASRLSEQTVRLWDLSSGKELRKFSLPSVNNGDGTSTGVNTWITFTSGGKVLAACGTDRKVRLWDVATGKELLDQTLRRRASVLIPEQKLGVPSLDWVTDVAFTSDGGTVAFSTVKHVYVADVGTGQATYQFDTSGSEGHLAFSPNGGMLLYSTAGNTFRLVELATGKELHAVELRDYILATAFSPSGKHVAVAAGRPGGTIYVFDVRTGKEVSRFQGHNSYVRCLKFSPDGTKLVSGQLDTTALVWDLTPALAADKTPMADLGPGHLDKLWTDLQDANAPKAQAAVWDLTDAGEKAVSLLEGRLKLAAIIQPERLRQLVADLDAEDFAGRDKASKELAKLGIEAEPALRKALDSDPTLEMRRRVTALLDGIAPQTAMTPDSLRQLRAIQVLEQIGSRQAQHVLKSLVQGGPAAPETRAAKAALERMKLRQPVPP